MKAQAGAWLAGVCSLLAAGAAGQQKPAAAQAAGGQAKAPHLEVSPAEVDFGEVWRGQDPVGQVTLKNTGNAPLKILKITTGCGCTTVNKPKTELAPGESDVLRIKYHSKRKRAGKIRRTVTIRSNDPAQPVTRVRLVGQVKQLVKGEPADTITFGRISGEQAFTKSIELKVTYDKQVFLKLKEQSAQPARSPGRDAFALKLDELEPGLRYRLTATTRPPLARGVVTRQVTLLTGLEQIPEITVRVYAIVQERVSVSPTLLYVPPQLNRPSRRIVRVSCLEGQQVKITKIESDCDKITAELRQPTTARARRTRFAQQQIVVNLPPGKELPEGGARLVIHTNDPEPKYAELVVRITNRRPVYRRPGLRRPPPPRPKAAPRTPPGKKPAAKPGQPKPPR